MGIFWCISITNNVESCKKYIGARLLGRGVGFPERDGEEGAEGEGLVLENSFRLIANVITMLQSSRFTNLIVLFMIII